MELEDGGQMIEGSFYSLQQSAHENEKIKYRQTTLSILSTKIR